MTKNFQDTIESDCYLVVAELNVDIFNFWNLWNFTFYFDNCSKISHCPSQHRELILLCNRILRYNMLRNNMLRYNMLLF